MPDSTEFYVRKLDETQRYFKDGIMYADNDEDLVDLLGAGMNLERALGGLRRSAAVELEGGVVGEQFKFKQGKESVKTYNSHGLLLAFATALDMGVLETILYLLSENALVLDWKFQPIERLAGQWDVTLTIAAHDIEDGDERHLIGKRWKDASPTYEPQ